MIDFLRFGEFQNVFLSEGELAPLQSDFPNRYVEYIDRLSVYMASNGRHYAENWDSFKRDEIGLLLFGGVGTGKSYAAGCIANALIDRLESVLFVGMSDVVNRMQGSFGSDRDIT